MCTMLLYYSLYIMYMYFIGTWQLVMNILENQAEIIQRIKDLEKSVKESASLPATNDKIAVPAGVRVTNFNHGWRLSISKILKINLSVHIVYHRNGCKNNYFSFLVRSF